MKTKQYSNIGPALFIPQALGAVAGGVGGFLKARREAKASGEKVTFKNAWDDVLLGAGKGALNPLAGAAGLATQGLGSVNDKQQLDAANRATQDANAGAVIPQAVADPLAIPGNPGAGGMGGIVNPNDPTGALAAAGLKKGKVQNSSFNNNPVFSPSSAGLMMGIYKK
jgi:hypothetical protein